MSTTLAFNIDVTVPSGVGVWSPLGTVDVHEFTQIRVLAYTHKDSTAAAKIHLIMIEGEESIADMDIISVEPQSAVSRVYDVPGKMLQFVNEGPGPNGETGVGVVVYGRV